MAASSPSARRSRCERDAVDDRLALLGAGACRRRPGRRSRRPAAMPLRRPRSWPPPRSIGWSRTGSRTTSAPTPCGPPNLCPLSDTRSAGAAALGDVEPGERLHRVGVEHRAGRLGVDDRPHGREVLHGPDLVAGQHHRHDTHRRPPSPPEHPGEVVEVDRPAAVDRRHAPAPARTGSSTAWCSTRCTPRTAPAARHARHGQVVGLRAPAGEHDLAGPASDAARPARRGRRRPRAVRAAGQTVRAGRVAVDRPAARAASPRPPRAASAWWPRGRGRPAPWGRRLRRDRPGGQTGRS